MGKTVYNFSNRLQRVKGRGAARARLITGKRCFVDDNPACEGNREAEGERKGQRSIGKIPSPVFFFFSRTGTPFPLPSLDASSSGLSISNLTGVASAVGIPVQSSSRVPGYAAEIADSRPADVCHYGGQGTTIS